MFHNADGLMIARHQIINLLKSKFPDEAKPSSRIKLNNSSYVKY